MRYCVGTGGESLHHHPNSMTTITTIAGTAGRIAGTAAKSILWINDQIDWAEVSQIVIDGIKVLIVLTFLAGRATRMAWAQLLQASEHLGCWYATLLTPTVIPIMIHPLADLAHQLEQLTCRELRAITGCRRHLSKAQLIELAVICI